MKANKKGFTLIELLAVIVILAVIALIATPIILNVIKDAKESASKSSALGYLESVEKYAALSGSQASLANYDVPAPTQGTTCTITDGKASEPECIAFFNAVYNTTKGEKPSSASITFTTSGTITAEIKMSTDTPKWYYNGNAISKDDIRNS